jgi:hypothetical protein
MVRQVATTDQNNILTVYERGIPREASQRCLSATDCKGKTHAGHRTGMRLFGYPEISVGVDVDQAHRSLRRLTRTQKGSQHDTAVAAQHHCKTAAAGCLLHTLAERPAIGADLGFVPGSARWTYVVTICGRDDIAQVAGAQALHET